MPLCLVVAAIDLDDVAQALECVKGEPDGQGDVQDFLRVRPAEMLCEGYQVGTTEIQIFEDEEHQTGGDDADHEAGFLFRDILFPFLNENAGGVIYRNGNQQDKDVFWNEPHVEEAAGCQEHQPAPFVRQQIEQ